MDENNRFELTTKIDDEWYTCQFWSSSKGMFYVKYTHEEGNTTTLCSCIGDTFEHSEHLARLMLKEIIK